MTRTGTVAGVVLTGGASRRMGRDKALIEVDGVPLADRVASVLHRAGCDPVIAIGGEPDALARLATPVVPDRHPGDGPLAGILRGLELSATGELGGRAWVLAVACDLPDLTPEAVRAVMGVPTTLHDRRIPGASGPVDVVVARTDRLEPTVAMWSVSASAALTAMHAEGERALHRVIARLRHVEVTVDAAAVRNVNRPGDLGPEHRP